MSSRPLLSQASKGGLPDLAVLFHNQRGCVEGMPDSKSGCRRLGLDQCHLEGQKGKADQQGPFSSLLPSLPLLGGGTRAGSRPALRHLVPAARSSLAGGSLGGKGRGMKAVLVKQRGRAKQLAALPGLRCSLPARASLLCPLQVLVGPPWCTRAPWSCRHPQRLWATPQDLESARESWAHGAGITFKALSFPASLR